MYLYSKMLNIQSEINSEPKYIKRHMDTYIKYPQIYAYTAIHTYIIK